MKIRPPKPGRCQGKTEAALRIEVIPGCFLLGPFMRSVSMIGSEPDGTR